MNPLAAALTSYKPQEVDDKRVPYLAGMNRQGTKLFFSRDFPHQLKLSDGTVMDPKPFVTKHEEVETALMRQGLEYQHAHRIATRVENALVGAAGINPAHYEAALKPYINAAHVDPHGKEPGDLNPEPYKDEHDYKDEPHARPRG